jgi:hypothetical protein
MGMMTWVELRSSGCGIDRWKEADSLSVEMTKGNLKGSEPLLGERRETMSVTVLVSNMNRRIRRSFKKPSANEACVTWHDHVDHQRDDDAGRDEGGERPNVGEAQALHDRNHDQRDCQAEGKDR